MVGEIGVVSEKYAEGASEGPWEIVYNLRKDQLSFECKHCHSPESVEHVRMDGTKYSSVTTICPRVVRVDNEGGCSCTELCIDCLLEKLNGR